MSILYQHLCLKLLNIINKVFGFIIIIIISLTSCRKTPITIPAPLQPKPIVEMTYTNLNNREIKYQQSGATLDVNNDNRADLFFGVQLVGDQINAVDKRQFIVVSSINTFLAVNLNEQILPLSQNDSIKLENFNGSNWYNASEIILMERNEFATGTILWRGNWVDRGKRYMPFQIYKNDQRYNGWIELTADKEAEKIILHRMAISKEAEKNIIAGK